MTHTCILVTIPAYQTHQKEPVLLVPTQSQEAGREGSFLQAIKKSFQMRKQRFKKLVGLLIRSSSRKQTSHSKSISSFIGILISRMLHCTRYYLKKHLHLPQFYELTFLSDRNEILQFSISIILQSWFCLPCWALGQYFSVMRMRQKRSGKK